MRFRKRTKKEGKAVRILNEMAGWDMPSQRFGKTALSDKLKYVVRRRKAGAL